MRIALISSLFPPFDYGGAEKIAAQLALGLHRLGHEVDVISTCRANELSKQDYRTDTWEGIRVWRIAPWNLYWNAATQGERPNKVERAAWHAVDLWNPSIFTPASHALDCIKPDVINTHNIDGLSPAVWQVARHYTRAILHTLHDYHLVCPRATMTRADGTVCETLCRSCSLYARYHRLFQKYVRVLIAPSSAVAGIHMQCGWTSPSIEVIRNAVDVGEVRLPNVPPAEPLHLLFLGRLVREKGCDTLLNVMTHFQHCSEICFHIAGRGGYETRFAEMARHMSNVQWHGFVSGAEKQALLSSSDVLLQLSECAENAPLSLIEAKRYGLYLLGTDAGGIPELIDSPEVGRLIPIADGEMLLRTLRLLVPMRQRIRSGRIERLYKSAGYGVRQMAERYAGVFRSSLDLRN